VLPANGQYAVWITQLRRRDSGVRRFFKLPAARALDMLPAPDPVRGRLGPAARRPGQARSAAA
jgi:hypothetical protein